MKAIEIPNLVEELERPRPSTTPTPAPNSTPQVTPNNSGELILEPESNGDTKTKMVEEYIYHE